MDVAKFITEEKIAEKVKLLSKKLDQFVGDDEAVIIANLKGSFMFFSDIVRSLKSHKVMIDFLSTESYDGDHSTGNVKITRDLSIDIKNRKVVLIEDIVDTGLTLDCLIRYIKEIHEPKDIKVCVLLDKPSRRKVNVQVDMTGFEIEDKFVVGYGLDYNEMYRNLPYIAILNAI